MYEIDFDYLQGMVEEFKAVDNLIYLKLNKLLRVLKAIDTKFYNVPQVSSIITSIIGQYIVEDMDKQDADYNLKVSKLEEFRTKAREFHHFQHTSPGQLAEAFERIGKNIKDS